MDDPEFADVFEISKRWMKAWMDQDRATLESILAPDYTLLVSTVPTRPFERENWLATAVGTYVCTRFEYEGAHFKRIDDDLIVMSAIADFDAEIDGVDRSGRYFLTDIWRRSPAGWQVCARYSSRPGEVDASVRAMMESQRG